MRLDMIRSFVQLVRRGSYTAAASDLYMSNTTLFSHIKSLESEIGAQLVHFNGRRLILTSAGTQFLLFAEHILAEYDRFQHNIRRIQRNTQKTLRVASLPAPSVHLLPPVIRLFQQNNPHIHVIVDARFTNEALAALVSGHADIAVIHAAHAEQARRAFEIVPIISDRLVAVIRNEDYAPPDTILFERYPLAIQPFPSISRQFVEQWSKRRNITINPMYEHASFDAIIQYVLSGGCIGIVGAYTVQQSPIRDLLTVLHLPDFECERRIVALYPARADHHVQQFAQFFCQFYDSDLGARGRSS